MTRLAFISAILMGIATQATAQDQTAQDQTAQDQTAQDQKDLALSIAQRVETLQNLRSQRRLLIQTHGEQTSADTRVLESLKASLAAAEAELAIQTRDMEALAAQKAESQQRTEKAQNWVRGTVAVALPLAQSVVERIGAGVPVEQTQRAAPLQKAIEVLRDDKATASELSPAIAGILDRIGEEIAVAKSVELSNTEILLEGGQRKETVWRLRLGLIDAMFVSENGKTAGLWLPGSGEFWNLDLDEETRKKIEVVLNVARERQPPQLAPLPLPVPPAQPAASTQRSARP